MNGENNIFLLPGCFVINVLSLFSRLQIDWLFVRCRVSDAWFAAVLSTSLQQITLIYFAGNCLTDGKDRQLFPNAFVQSVFLSRDRYPVILASLSRWKKAKAPCQNHTDHSDVLFLKFATISRQTKRRGINFNNSLLVTHRQLIIIYFIVGSQMKFVEW